MQRLYRTCNLKSNADMSDSIPFLSYTSVKALTRIRRERMLPARGDVLATIGSRVDPLDVVARTNAVSHLRPIPLARYMHLNETVLDKYLLRKPGEPIVAREVIASRPELFGTLVRIYRAPGPGRVAALQGSWMALELADPPVELKALYRGSVVSVTPRVGIVIEAVGTLVQGVWGGGGEGYGVLKRMVDTPDALLEENKIDVGARGAVLLAGAGISEAAIRRAAREHAAGLIVGGLTTELKDLVEQLGLATIVTEGFGQHPMSGPIFELLAMHVGEETSLNTVTRPRGGATRPEIFVPAIDTTSKGLDAPEPVAPEAQVGAVVRILGGPHQYEIGKIKEVSKLPVILESGVSVWGAEVERATGKAVFVPWENLELIG